MSDLSLPWKAVWNNMYWEIRTVEPKEDIYPPQIGDLTACAHWFDPETAKSAAEFIVRAVNCHAELLEALKKIAEHPGYPDDLDGDPCQCTACKFSRIARAAIRKAEAR